MRFNLKIQSSMLISKARQLFKRVTTALRSGKYNDQPSLMTKLTELFTTFFSGLKKKTSEPLVLHPDDFRDPSAVNQYFSNVHDDLEVILNESNTLRGAITEAVNFSLGVRRNIDGRVKALAGSSIDLKLINGVPDNQTLAAGDQFVDDSKIDNEFPVPGARSKLVPGQAVVTLTPVDVYNLSGNENISISRIRATSKPYEGKYYSYLGEMEPEGDVFPAFTRYVVFQEGTGPASQKARALRQRWANLLKSSSDFPDLSERAVDASNQQGTFYVPSNLDEILDRMKSDPDFVAGRKTYGVGTGITMFELEMIAGGVHTEFAGKAVLPYSSLSENEIPKDAQIVYRPVSPSAIALSTARIKAIDGDPNNYLRLETTFPVRVGWGVFSDAQINDFSNRNDWTEFKNMLGSYYGTDELSTFLDTQKAGKPQFFEAEVTIDLGTVSEVNFLTLIPDNESVGGWLEVRDIRLGETESAMQQLPGMNANKFDNILTREANSFLSEEESLATMAPSRGDYTGVGLWTFPAVSARFIKFVLRQRTLSPAPYERLRLKLSREVSTKKRTTKKVFGITLSAKESTTTTTESKTFLAPYEVSLLLIGSSAQPLSNTEEATATGQILTGVAKTFGKKTDVLGISGDFGKFFYNTLGTGTQTKTWTSASPWQVEEQTKEMMFDKARYSILLRDIGIFRYRYAEESTLVSKLFRTPLPISKLVFHADEFIPPALLEIDYQEPWLRYEVSFDDTNWYEITPLSPNVVRNQDGIPVPQIINVNSEIPADFRNPRERWVSVQGQPQQVRMRAIFKRPEDLPNISPALRSYNMVLSLNGSLV